MSQRNPTANPAARPERDGFPVVVHVKLVRGDRIFLLRRSATGFMDGYYGLPGGHQRQGESVSEAAMRECREEAGVLPVHLEPRCVLPYISGRHQGLNFLFEAERFEGEPHIAEPDLFDDSCWATRDNLPARVTPWLLDALAMPPNRWFREFRWD